MKKGFTLIELVAVIIILGIIAVITIPVADKVIKDSKETLYKAQIEDIIEGAKAWSTNNASSLPTEGKMKTITLGELQKGGYIDKDLENPKTGLKFSETTLITIENKNGGFNYQVHE